MKNLSSLSLLLIAMLFATPLLALNLSINPNANPGSSTTTATADVAVSIDNGDGTTKTYQPGEEIPIGEDTSLTAADGSVVTFDGLPFQGGVISAVSVVTITNSSEGGQSLSMSAGSSIVTTQDAFSVLQGQVSYTQPVANCF